MLWHVLECYGMLWIVMVVFDCCGMFWLLWNVMEPCRMFSNVMECCGMLRNVRAAMNVMVVMECFGCFGFLWNAFCKCVDVQTPTMCRSFFERISPCFFRIFLYVHPRIILRFSPFARLFFQDTNVRKCFFLICTSLLFRTATTTTRYHSSGINDWQGPLTMARFKYPVINTSG